MGREHIKTIMDLLEIFEPYLTEKDILEAIEECKKFREKKPVNLHVAEIKKHETVIDFDEDNYEWQ